MGDGLGLEISAAGGPGHDRARDRAAAGSSAGAAAGEVDLAGLAEQVTEQGREISELARTIARMRRRLEEEGILVAETAEEGAGRRADAM